MMKERRSDSGHSSPGPEYVSAAEARPRAASCPEGIDRCFKAEGTMVCIRKDKFVVKVKAKKSFGFLAGSVLCLRLDIIAGTK